MEEIRVKVTPFKAENGLSSLHTIQISQLVSGIWLENLIKTALEKEQRAEKRGK